MDAEARRTVETVDLLQTCIRNACVNDGSAASGQEARSAEAIRTYLEGAGLVFEELEPTPGRRSLVTRIEGSDPEAPSLLLMGHTDVVPVNPSGWRHDPFGAEIIDGPDGPEVWGRGAIDMLNLTCSMAVAMRHLALAGARPRGTITYLAVADEEAGGEHGARWLVRHALDRVGADYVITESGGVSLESRRGHGITVTVGEKGIAWHRLVVRGTPGHGSMPYGADNALVKAAEVVRRLAAYRGPTVVDDVWRRYAAALDLPDDVVAALQDPLQVRDALSRIPDHGTAKFAHACTHTTISPNVVHGGQKTNVIPDEVTIELDIRTLPGHTLADVRRQLEEAIGPELLASVVIEPVREVPATASPTQTPLFDVLEKVARRFHPDATLVPRITAGGTDATFFRQVGATAYGFGLFSRRLTPGAFASRFHGNDERVDVESLRLTTEAWMALAERW